MRTRALLPALLALAALAAWPGASAPAALVAQERGDTARADTLLSARDSAQARVRARLASLARPPGARPDTVADTLAAAANRAGARGGGASLPPSDSIMTALARLPGYRVTRYQAVAAHYDAAEEQLILYGSRGAPDIAPVPERDTLTTAEADSVLALADSLRARADSLVLVVTGTPEPEPADSALAVARVDSLLALEDSLRARAERPEEPPVVPAVLASPEGGRLEAERMIRFNQRTEVAEARGAPTFAPARGGDPVVADSLNIDIAGQRASAFAARTRYQQGGGTDWNVTGDLPYVGDQVVYGSHTRFTSCDLEEPHYHFATDNLKIVQGQILVARPVRLYFADVPVAWLPFVAQSLASGRASGLLTPRFSVNDIVRTSGGYRRRISNVGFYWAMSDYTDATVALDWFDENYTALTGSLRFSWLRQFLDGSINVRQYWRDSGSTERSLDSRTRWEPTERTNFSSSIRYVTSTDFVNRNSFDPTEITQRITSSGGLSHRFDWGTLNVSGNRNQSLSDDVVDMTLPDVSLSLNSLTLFPAPMARAEWFNNLTWNGSANYRRAIVDRPADTLGFSFGTADRLTTNIGANSSFSLGDFSLSQRASYQEGTTRAVPIDSLIFFPESAAHLGLQAFDTRLGQAWLRAAGRNDGWPRPPVIAEGESRRVDVAEGTLSWSTSLNYTRNLIGSTTFTPSLSLSGNALRSDTIDVAQSFVAGPTRISFGANLKADVYGFYPGFGEFEAVRHKLTSSASYDWSPEVDPTDLQVRVFDSRLVRPQSVMSISLNQTWEAKRQPEQDTTAADTAAVDTAGVAGEAGEGAAPPGEGAGRTAEDEPVGVEATPPDIRGSDAGTAGDETGPRRLEQGQIVNLLSIRTSAVRYDFEGDTLGFLHGFTSTKLSNQISSDFLRGLSVSMSHDLFADTVVGEGEGATPRRRFDPHLESLSFGFDLNPNSTIFRLLGLGEGSGFEEEEEEEPDPTADEPYPQRSATDETSIMPGSGTDQDVRESRGPDRDRTGGARWRANFNYALSRPRHDDDETSQMLRIGLNMTPSAQWEMRWNTAYDLERGEFNDHRIRLTRDLHRWQAHFDFLKTTTGNWTFRFEVSLLDNQDLHFDYEQRNLIDQRR